MDTFPNLKLIDYGFHWKFDPYLNIIAMTLIGFYLKNKLFHLNSFLTNSKSSLSFTSTALDLGKIYPLIFKIRMF